MRYIFKGNEMKQIDQFTINETKIPSLVLMERASLAVASEIMSRFDENVKIVVVCGNGNNGADGLCVARILCEYGYNASYVYDFDKSTATEELRLQLQICENENIEKVTISAINNADVIVDAIFGIGCTRSVKGVYKDYIDKINKEGVQGKYIVAVDVPSGINSETGEIMDCAINANLTVTFGYEKYGMCMYPAKNNVGEVVIRRAGFAKEAIEQFDRKLYTYEKEDLDRIPKREQSSNKGTYGKVLVIAGSRKISGAAYFSAAAAYNTGAGIVRILTHSNNKIILATTLLEAMLEEYDKLSDKEIQNLIDISDVIVIGPGIGTDDDAIRLMNIVIKNDKPIIIDADGINVLAKEKMLDRVSNLKRNNKLIITPHLGEMSRLTNMSIPDIKKDALKVCDDFAKEYNLICVLKDAKTIVSDGSGDIYINSSGNSGMSTGGSGDVLTGIIAGLIVNGVSLFEASSLGVYVHGLSGDSAATKKSERSLMASDIIKSIGDII